MLRCSIPRRWRGTCSFDQLLVLLVVTHSPGYNQGVKSETLLQIPVSRRQVLRSAIGARSSAMFAKASPRSRVLAIDDAISRLETECKKLGGDWYTWQKSLQPLRQAVWPRIKAAWDNPTVNPERPGEKGAPLVKLFGFTPDRYYEAGQMVGISGGHAGAAENLDWFIAANTAIPIMVEVSRWLSAQDIDLFVVPAPVPPIIAPEGVVEDATLIPSHGIVAPFFRRELLELLRKGVEAVDPFPAILNAHQQGRAGLTIVCDTHWGPLAHRLAAEETAKHLYRFDWVKKALERKHVYTTRTQPCDLPATLMTFLPAKCFEQLSPYRKIDISLVITADGEPVKPMPGAQVLVTGDSFVDYGTPYAATFSAHLSRLLNLPIPLLRFDGNTVQSIREMAREPEVARRQGCRLGSEYGQVQHTIHRWLAKGTQSAGTSPRRAATAAFSRGPAGISSPNPDVDRWFFSQ